MKLDQPPTEQDQKIAAEIFREFSQQPGAQHIATEFALSHLSRLLFQTKPQIVLEFGAGIGTITKLLLDHPVSIDTVVSTENNDFCLKSLAKNIGQGYGKRWILLQDIEQLLELNRSYHLVIFDGVLGDERRYSIFDAGTWCFVEGIRRPTRHELANYLATRKLDCQFTSYIRPQKLRLSKKKFLGFLPKFKWKTHKGCHIGLVTRTSS